MHIILPHFFINCERWKWNPDLRIYVSTHGHVKNQYKQNVPLKINRGGYFCVDIEGKLLLVHRLVLLTWRPLPVDGEPMTVDHLDSNKRNNRLDNLEWVSEEENLRRADEKLAKEDAPKVCEKINKQRAIKLSPQNQICGERVTWDSLAKRGISKEKLLGTTFKDVEQERTLLRNLFTNGTIVAFWKGQQITSELLTSQPGIPSEASKDKVLDRFLLRSIRGQKSFGKVSQLYWRKE